MSQVNFTKRFAPLTLNYDGRGRQRLARVIYLEVYFLWYVNVVFSTERYFSGLPLCRLCELMACEFLTFVFHNIGFFMATMI